MSDKACTLRNYLDCSPVEALLPVVFIGLLLVVVGMATIILMRDE